MERQIGFYTLDNGGGLYFSTNKDNLKHFNEEILPLYEGSLFHRLYLMINAIEDEFADIVIHDGFGPLELAEFRRRSTELANKLIGI